MKTPYFNTIYIFILLLLSPLVRAEDNNNKWQGYVEFLGKSGTTRSLGQTDIFLPLSQNNDSLLFFNIRGHIDDQDSTELNLGLGYRQLFDRWILGSWGYFDIRNSENDNTFVQGNLGFEALSNQWDFRINGYIPESTEKRTNRNDKVVIANNSIGVRLGLERALPGFDAEIGYRLPILEDLRVYAGGFYFDADGYEKVTGPRVRMELKVHDLPFLNEGSRLSFGFEVSHDDVRDTEVYGLVQLRIPFSFFKSNKNKKQHLSYLERRMLDPIVRDVDIVSGTSLSKPLQVRSSSGGGPISRQVVVDANSDIATEVTSAGENSLVIIDGAAGRVDTAGITMTRGQTLAGGGTAMDLFFIADGKLESIRYTPTGSRAIINGTGADVITVHSGNVNSVNTIQNLTIMGGTGDGITTAVATSPTTGNMIEDRANVILIDSTIDGVGGNGIELDDSSRLIVVNSTIENTGARGIVVDDVNTVNIRNSIVRGTGSQGVSIGSENNANIHDVSFSQTVREALTFDSRNTNVMVSNVRFNDVGTSGQEAIQLLDGNNIIFNNIMIDGTGNDGIRTTNNNILHFSNIGISNTAGQGIEFDDDNTITLMSVTIDDTASDAIEIANSNTVSIRDLFIGNNSAANSISERGLDLFDNNMVTMTNVMISNTVDDGIRFSDGNTAVITELTLTDIGNQGVHLDGTDGNNDISIRDSVISDTTSHGIELADAPDADNAHRLTLNNVIINDAGSRGILIQNFNTGSFNNVTVNRSAIRGIQFDNDNNFVLDDITIADVASFEGLKVFDRNTLNITNLSVTGIQDDGLDFRDNNIIELNNSEISNITGAAITLRNSNELTGMGNRVVAPAGSACNVGTGNTGNFAFTDVIGGGSGTCP